MKLVFAAQAAVFVGCVLAPHAGTTAEAQTANPSDKAAIPAARITAIAPEKFDIFGSSIALENGTLAVASPGASREEVSQGSISIYRGRAFAWVRETVIVPENLRRRAFFGETIALDGTGSVLAASLPTDATLGTGTGSVRIFTREAGPDGFPAWSESQRLFDPEAEPGDGFGADISIGADVLAIGVPRDSSAAINGGAVRTYTNVNGTWELFDTVTAPDAGPLDAFGSTVRTDGQTLVVAATLANHAGTDSGAVYVYRRTPGGWEFEDLLLPPGLAAFDRLGLGLSVVGSTIAVGAPGRDSGGVLSSGAVHLFERSGATWEHDAVLTADEPSVGAQFGRDVELDGNRLLATAPHESVIEPYVLAVGAAHVLERTEADVWQTAGIARPETPHLADWFGFAATIDGDSIVVGEPTNRTPELTGNAQVFTVPPIGSGPRLVRVPGDAATVAEAIETVAPGGEVVIGPGTYSERIVITDKPLRVAGTSATGNRGFLPDPTSPKFIGDALPGPLLEITAGGSGSEVSGLFLRGGNVPRQSALSITGASTRLIGLDVSENFNADGATVAIREADAVSIESMRVSRNLLSGGGTSAVLVENSQNVELVGGLLFGNVIGTGAVPGIAAPSSDLKISQTTIATNRVVGGSTGFALGDLKGSRVSIVNSVLFGTGGGDIDMTGASSVIGRYTASGSVFAVGEGNMLVPDAPLEFFFEDAEANDFTPRLDSPLIDRGNNTLVPTDVSVDVFGQPRFAEDPGVPNIAGQLSPVVDLGAIEFQGSSNNKPCNPSDVAQPYRILNSSDISTFVSAFLTQDERADVAEPFGIVNATDINAFINGLLEGCVSEVPVF
ncbi:MAG: FG-GAP repeat protein [Planctomycetota bacterium]